MVLQAPRREDDSLMYSTKERERERQFAEEFKDGRFFLSLMRKLRKKQPRTRSRWKRKVGKVSLYMRRREVLIGHDTITSLLSKTTVLIIKKKKNIYHLMYSKLVDFKNAASTHSFLNSYNPF